MNIFTLPETSGKDIFLAKFSPQGKALWLRGFEVSGSKDWGHELAVDAFGNVILTGTIGGTLTIDGNELHHAGGKLSCLLVLHPMDPPSMQPPLVAPTMMRVSALPSHPMVTTFSEAASETASRLLKTSAKETWMPCSFALVEPLTKSP